jgi:hypothetical protein
LASASTAKAEKFFRAQVKRAAQRSRAARSASDESQTAALLVIDRQQAAMPRAR